MNMNINLKGTQASDTTNGVDLDKGIMVIEDNVEEELQKRVEEFQITLKNSPEVIQIANSIKDVNPDTILSFGNQPALEISKFSDKILQSLSLNSVEDSGKMFKNLMKVMDRIEPKDFKDETKGFLPKFFTNTKKQIEKILEKYQTVGSEIEVINTEILKYKEELNISNKNLEEMYVQNFKFYQTIEKYIAAGRIITDHIKETEIPQFEEKAKSGNQADVVALDNWKNALEMFEQRLYDLEMAKMVALQTAPQIRLIQRGNYKLVSKIHSAFIVTIPVFKQSIIQAVTLKRQRVIADSLTTLDEKTNELLLQNAQRTVDQSIQIARMSGASSIKVETIERNFEIILNGMAETKAIEDENSKIREEGTKKIQVLQASLQKKMLTGRN